MPIIPSQLPPFALETQCMPVSYSGRREDLYGDMSDFAWSHTHSISRLSGRDLSPVAEAPTVGTASPLGLIVAFQDGM